MKRLQSSFFLQPTLRIAQQLLGKVLVVRDSSKEFVSVINETEAYIGMDDLACHASKGKTKRNSAMWLEGGHLYVYLIYGMYHCVNVVTEQEGFPAAALLRGVIPLNMSAKTDGPGKLCKFFGITREDNALDLTRSDRIGIYDLRIEPSKIKRTPRIGVEYAKTWAKKPWRFIASFDNIALEKALARASNTSEQT